MHTTVLQSNHNFLGTQKYHKTSGNEQDVTQVYRYKIIRCCQGNTNAYCEESVCGMSTYIIGLVTT